MDDGWFVPGGAYITEDRKIRLHPPPDWVKVELVTPRTPPSMNVNQIRSHWSGFQRAKKEWQSEIEMLLMVEKVKRDHYQRALAGAFLRFPPHPIKQLAASQRRDTGNFATLLNKALGDALGRGPNHTGYGAIPDDDERRFYFGGVEFQEDPGAPRTTIWIFLQPPQEEG